MVMVKLNCETASIAGHRRGIPHGLNFAEDEPPGGMFVNRPSQM
jgi:hypothetical protein